MFCQVEKKVFKERSSVELSSAENSSKMEIQDGSFWGKIWISLMTFTQIILEKGLVGRDSIENKREENGTVVWIPILKIVLRYRDREL